MKTKSNKLYSDFLIANHNTTATQVQKLARDIRKKEWHFICHLQSNRLVCERQGDYYSIADLCLIDKQVRKVWLKEYGYVLVCKVVAVNGDIAYLATSDLTLTNYDGFTNHWQHRWDIKEFHRGSKQITGIEKCYSIKAESQKTHIFAAFTPFI